ncbi:hypothetical protein CLV45_1909 [Hymenobacter chitinivorans DSM 11115]|uniref:Uncharacterized protein n=1 Tax=Hymenobacter chitinivorans DSM 11115 TaxID=1121954 RepID=A0A2M9BRB2_9BACT|nr:hypothetical protein CLV45_1909 [Hymenobacter chitinivorans DSM 11115]
MPFSHYTFRALPIEEQLKVLWAEGTFLAARWQEQDRVYLYHVGSFFTEVYCDLTKHKRLSIRTCTNSEWLEGYAVYVRLDDLPI